ncbi:MAG: hypothetical protein WDN03_13445 [Rhizomicrobium sp.]
MQIAEPRSISACAKSPARRAGTSACNAARMSDFDFGSGAVMANTRAITRSALASIAACGRSKAIAAIAPAV